VRITLFCSGHLVNETIEKIGELTHESAQIYRLYAFRYVSDRMYRYAFVLEMRRYMDISQRTVESPVCSATSKISGAQLLLCGFTISAMACDYIVWCGLIIMGLCQTVSRASRR